MRGFLLYLPRRAKRLILILTDFFIVQLCLLLSFYLRLEIAPATIVEAYLPVFAVTPLVVLLVFASSELYSTVTRHSGPEVIIVFARGVSISSLLILLVFFLIPIQPQLPRSVLLMFWAFCILALTASRLLASRWLHGGTLSELFLDLAGWRRRRARWHTGVIIYGAGQAGLQLVSALSQSRRFHPVAFVDDDPRLQEHRVAGLKVYRPSAIEDLIRTNNVTDVLLALPSASRVRRQEIIKFLEPLDVHVRSIPGLEELAQGLVSVEDIREVDIADVLGREEVPANRKLLKATIRGRRIAVTGCGGSIGSELSRQILIEQPELLVLIDHSELNVYQIFGELQDKRDGLGGATTVIPKLLSVLDIGSLERALRDYGIDTVFHAAAYKHVPLVESNRYQGYRNNVLGTLYAATAAICAGVERFVLVSTDKAVRPTNIMGATKRLSELALQALSAERLVDFSGCPGLSGIKPVENSTHFTMVRFGNVLDSSGSVIPRFRAQIRAGGPLTVTHPEVTRYFMTIPEAAQLVLQANALSEGGDVFILDMGEPVKIDDLARRLVHLSGLTLRTEENPDGDIAIVYTGIRPGEKLYEELLIDDQARATEHPKIWRANERVIPWRELVPILVNLDQAFKENEVDTVAEILSRVEIGYQPAAEQAE